MILWSESNAFDRRRSWWRELPKRIFVGRMKAAHVYGSSNTRYLVSLGMSGERIFEKRAVVDTGLFRPVPERRNPGPCKVLLFVGRFVMVKNLPFLLRAFAAVRQNRQAPKLALRLVGYGPLENEMRNLAQDLGIGPLVEFHGAASQAELPGIYSAADIFVLPSISETFGMVVLEAMACGLPVVVSRRCGCASDLATAQTGWTFDPFCEADLTAVLERVAGLDAGELRRMGMAGRELAQAYSPERCADTVVRSVKRALQAAAGGEIGART
jgi:glycosyltransferase involved in cell wall biosynthesis